MLPEIISEIDGVEYGVTEASIWIHESKIQKVMFEEKGTVFPMELKLLDVHSLYKNTKFGRDFIFALA